MRHPSRPIPAAAGRLSRIAVATTVLVVAMVGAAPATAHSELRNSYPEDGASLSTPPVQVELEFDQAISPEFAAVALQTRTDEAAVPLVPRIVGARLTATVPHDVAATADTQWTLAYRVVSSDGHPITGEVGFSVAPGQVPTAVIPETPQKTPTSQPRTERAETGSQALPTIVIGLFTAGTTLGLMLLIARGRNRDLHS